MRLKYKIVHYVFADGAYGCFMDSYETLYSRSFVRWMQSNVLQSADMKTHGVWCDGQSDSFIPPTKTIARSGGTPSTG